MSQGSAKLGGMLRHRHPEPDQTAEPTADRPRMPDGYGLPETTEGLRPWADVDERLRGAETVWMATTRPDGRPHVVPRWGVWLDQRFYYDGAPTTRHTQNLLANPACALHLESGTDVVVLEGESRPATPPDPELAERLSAEFHRKYERQGYAPGPESWSGPDAGGLCVFVPRTGLTWSSFPTDATRYTFAAADGG